MNKTTYAKNLIRKIIEFNQKVDYFKELTALNRPEVIDKEIKLEREQIIAQLDMSDLVEKKDSLNYVFLVEGVNFDLVLKDLSSNTEIKLCGGKNGNNV